MAKQDFAQVKASSHAESRSDSGSGSGSILNAIAIFAIAGLCFSGGYWIGTGAIKQTGNNTDANEMKEKLAAQIAENRLLQAKNETLQDLAQQWKTKAEQGAHTKVGELTFYKELPKQSVTPAPVPDVPESATHVKPQQAKKYADKQQVETTAIQAPTHGAAHTAPTSAQQHAADRYRIQLASFRTEADAMTMRGKLQHAGFLTQIEMADLSDKGQWYRLYAGPYDSRTAAMTAQQKIDHALKLKGLLKRVR